MNLLLVGVGGIGCEFLEILCDFLRKMGQMEEISLSLNLVDSDTIEASNLPRQRLFTEQDISLPKAEVAASRLPAGVFATITAVNERIQAQTSEFFEKFEWVVMAVDDVDTRRWLNGAVMQHSPRLQMIIDCGSRGFQGSCRVYRGKGACLECTSWLLEDGASAGEGNGEGALIPVCQVHGQPRNLKDCIIWAAQSEKAKKSEVNEIILVAKERAESFSISSEGLDEKLVNSVLNLTVPAVASVNSLIAAKAVHLLFFASELNFYFYNLQEGIYEHSVLLEHDPNCPFC